MIWLTAGAISVFGLGVRPRVVLLTYAGLIAAGVVLMVVVAQLMGGSL